MSVALTTKILNIGIFGGFLHSILVFVKISEM